MDDVCFSGPALALLGGMWLVIQGVLVVLFWGWIRSLESRVKDAQSERDRALDGWEATIGLGETAVRRERRRPS